MEIGLIWALIMILILEILRYFSVSRRLIKEVDELKERVNYLEDIIKEKQN